MEQSNLILEKEFTTVFVEKAPFQLPENLKLAIVKYAPYIDLILMILLLPLLLAVFGMATWLGFWAAGYGYVAGTTYWLNIILGIATIALRGMALPGLFAQKRSGWTMVYYAALLDVIWHVVSFSIGGLLGSAISLFILFQIKAYYK